LLEFHSHVASRRVNSGKTLLNLRETAFYPTSGGQPHDTGLLDGIPVVDVFEDGDEIMHVLDGIQEGDEVVLGQVDWKRRHDHMQQHTGQHILSQALIEVCDTATVGFTIGPDWSTIVIERKPDAGLLRRALELANTVIAENRPVTTTFPTDAELKALPLRSRPPAGKRVRIVHVEGFDRSPCGGTHCTSTGDVRLIGVLGIRKEKQYRVEFVCGDRATRVFLGNLETIGDLSSLLEVGPGEVRERVGALLAKSRDQENRLRELRDNLMDYECKRLLGQADEFGGTIAAVLDNWTTGETRKLAHKLVEASGVVALLVAREPAKMGLVFARSADRGEDMNRLMQSVGREFGFRGGGNPAFATGGGGSPADAERTLQHAKLALEQ
jgi:alanyl-tRNA synthetase